MEAYTPISNLFSNEDIVELNYVKRKFVLSKNKAKYTVYITTDDDNKYSYEEINTSDDDKSGEYEENGKIIIDPHERSLTFE